MKSALRWMLSWWKNPKKCEFILKIFKKCENNFNKRGKSLSIKSSRKLHIFSFPIGFESMRMSLESRLTRSWYEHCSLHSAICITDIHSFSVPSSVFSTHQSIPKREATKNTSQQNISTPKRRKKLVEIFSLVARLNWIESDSMTVLSLVWFYHWVQF